MSKKTQTINKFRTSKANKDFVDKLKQEQTFVVSESTIVDYLLELGIQAYKSGKRLKKEI